MHLSCKVSLAYFSDLRSRGLAQVDGMGYRLAYRIARENLLLGNVVIADSVNPWKLTRIEWNDVAESAGARFVNIEVLCSDKAKHKKRVVPRRSAGNSLVHPTWDEVLKRDYETWHEDRVVLDTAEKSEDESFAELVSKLRSRDMSL